MPVSLTLYEKHQSVIEEVLSTVMHKNPDTVIKTIPLSNNSISQCIDEMATNVKH